MPHPWAEADLLHTSFPGLLHPLTCYTPSEIKGRICDIFLASTMVGTGCCFISNCVGPLNSLSLLSFSTHVSSCLRPACAWMTVSCAHACQPDTCNHMRCSLACIRIPWGQNSCPLSERTAKQSRPHPPDQNKDKTRNNIKHTEEQTHSQTNK